MNLKVGTGEGLRTRSQAFESACYSMYGVNTEYGSFKPDTSREAEGTKKCI